MTRETQTVELRKQDLAMIDALIGGKKWLEAAKQAQYTDPGNQAAALMIDPRALAYAYRKTRGRLTLEGAPSAFNLMLRVMNDENRDMRLRIDIAKHLFSAAGFTPPKAADAQPTDDPTDLADMTPMDIQRMMVGVSAELKRRKQAEADAKPAQAIEDMF